MKHLLIALSIMGLVSTSVLAQDKEPPRTKEVCKDVVGKDGKPVKNKDGSVKQTCKTIKIHKKYEGTEVPTKK
jgi:hypothetical protein